MLQDLTFPLIPYVLVQSDPRSVWRTGEGEAVPGCSGGAGGGEAAGGAEEGGGERAGGAQGPAGEGWVLLSLPDEVRGRRNAVSNRQRDLSSRTSAPTGPVDPSHTFGLSLSSLRRKAFFSLREENDQLKKHQPTERDRREEQGLSQEEEEEEEEEEELDLDLEEEEEAGSPERWEAYDEGCPPQGGGGPLGQRTSTRPLSLDLGALLAHSSQVGGALTYTKTGYYCGM